MFKEKTTEEIINLLNLEDDAESKNVYGLANDIEYIIIQEENPKDIEDTTGRIIAKLTPNGFEVSDGYMVRTKFKES